MSDIEIHGFTAQQRVLADILWACDSQEQCDRLINALPYPFRTDAIVVRDTIAAAAFDQYEGTDDADSLLERFKR
jgi:23S rRNA C2498 (ribose-2'-O)-methylase RlmM